MDKCIAYGLAKNFHISALRDALSERYRMVEYREVFHLQNGGNLFVFPFGVAVFWGFSPEDERRLIDELSPFYINPLETPVEDRFEYSIGTDKIRIHEDHIYLTSLASQEMLAISHGIAQSVKLAELEAYAGKTVEETAYIPQNMAETGSTKLSRRDIARMRGKLFLVDSDINHHYALLDPPEFFWEYPELEGYYLEVARYLDVQSRVAVLNKKMEMIHKLFSMLADEQNHKHSSLLEWIIIWLIAIEIVIFLGEIVGLF